MTIPQYAKTTNPEVLAAVQANKDGFWEFHQRACDFAIAQGVEKGSYFPSSFAGSHHIRAIGGDTKPTTGQWKKGYGGYGWLPFKNNPLTQELEKISFKEADVPGLPSLVRGPERGWSHTIATPQPFILDGAVYVGFSFAPQDEDGTKQVEHEPYGWVEILASEYAKAVETYNARAKAAGRDDD